MLFIVIPVFNRKNFTRDCLLSLQNQTNKNFEIVIVDDGSTDGTSDMINAEFPKTHILYGDGSLWWTASVNMGIKFSLERGATMVITLNNDVIATEDFIEKMIFWSEKYPDALLGAIALDVKGRMPIYGGERLNWKNNKSIKLLNIIPKEKQKGLHEVSYFPGRGLLIPRKVIEKIGLFAQDKFPHYFADYDYTSQAKIKGYKVYCNYDARLLTYPDESGDFQNRKKKTVKNYYNHLFGIKGGGNLINFTRFAFRNCPPFLIPNFLLNGYLRRVFGYLIR